MVRSGKQSATLPTELSGNIKQDANIQLICSIAARAF
jgi:hypothetical protein